MNKDHIQAEAVKAWVGAGFNGLVLLPTGTGKTRVGRLCHDISMSTSTIIVTSRVAILDGWKKEFGERPSTMLVINSAAKRDLECDLLIVDECHRALSSKMRNVFTCIKYKKLLCLTATLPKEQEYVDFLYSVCKLIYQQTMADVVLMDKVVSNFQVFNLETDADFETKKKYRLFQSQFQQASIELSQLKRIVPELFEFKSLFDIAKTYSSRSEPVEVVRAAKAFWWAMSMRKRVLYENKHKIKVISEIINKNPGKKWIIFSKSISFADEVAKSLGVDSYHSKTKDKEEVMAKFRDGRSTIISTVDAINEGVDIVDADAAIAVSSVSTELIGVQQLGRVSRYLKDKNAIFYNLYVKDTPEERWVRDKTANLNPTWITSVS